MKFEAYIKEHFPDDWDTEWAESEPLQNGMEYALTSGGKRIRPLLCLKLCECLGGDMEQATVFARAIEAYHNFTLVHDDILDKDTHRRGQEAVWEKYGIEQGIDIGDGLHALAYKYLVNNREMFDAKEFSSLISVLNEADRAVMDGQSFDLAFRDRDDLTEEEYLCMARKKTGVLLAAALEGAAIIAEADETVKEQVDIFGTKIGPAFQIRDDVIDLVGKKGRDMPGNDVKEGKRSLIVIYALERLESEERAELLQVLDKEKEETTTDDVGRAIELFKSVDAIDDANSMAEKLAAEANAALEEIEGYDVSEVQEIADFLVERKF